MFPTEIETILNRIEAIDPFKYASTRNFLDGAVTKLSPYISRGVISTKQVYDSLKLRGFTIENSEKLIQELAWRDYWQQVWMHKGNAINTAIRNEQTDVLNHEIATAITDSSTGIIAIDDGIKELYTTGYMHNHLRMYTAAISCNMAKNHWLLPAKWMYYHLLDGDWASNALSWQWVAGTNSNKKYVANQENINKYCYTKQSKTWLDIPYSDFDHFEQPSVLQEHVEPDLETKLPVTEPLKIDAQLPCYLYTSYNLDYKWDASIAANRILILEPAHFKKYPISEKVLAFILSLAKNITDIQIYVGSFEALKKEYPTLEINYKEHPFSNHFEGIQHERDWMFDVKGDFRSFFGFWKKCKKSIC